MMSATFTGEMPEVINDSHSSHGSDDMVGSCSVGLLTGAMAVLVIRFAGTSDGLTRFPDEIVPQPDKTAAAKMIDKRFFFFIKTQSKPVCIFS